MTRCTACEHQLRAHQAEGDGKVGACRITGCDCQTFVEPEELITDAEPRSRRVCIDVPDGYVLSMSLIPDKEGSDA